MSREYISEWMFSIMIWKLSGRCQKRLICSLDSTLPIEAAGLWNLHLTAEALKQILVYNAI